ISIYIGKTIEKEVEELLAKGYTASDIFKAGVFYLKHGQKIEDELKTKWYELYIRISSFETILSTLQFKLNELNTKLSDTNSKLAEIEKSLQDLLVSQSTSPEQKQ
ncbi:MAG: hypothetical protein ACP5GJ_04590, partial [Nanopusillaceae archaeon]